LNQPSARHRFGLRIEVRSPGTTMQTLGRPPILRLLLALMTLPAIALAAPTTSTKDPAMRFEVKGATRTQELRVQRSSERSVSFEFTIGGDCQRTTAGEARLQGGAPKLQKDEKGRPYPAQEFIHLSEGCGLVLRIDAKQARRATVKQAGPCHNLCVPLPDVMLRDDRVRGKAKP
jgi:hypothetical protein